MGYSIQYSTKSGLGNPAIEVYLYGCDKPIPCSSCHNKELLSIPKEQTEFGLIVEDLSDIILKFNKFHSRLYISFVGGEPTAPHNIDKLKDISKYVKNNFKDSITVLYSWKPQKEIEKMNLNYIDYGVLGEYIDEQYVKNQIPSSNNQTIYDFNCRKTINNIKLKGE